MRSVTIWLLLAMVFFGNIHTTSAQGGGPPGADVVSIAVDQTSADTIYVATNGGGVFKSINGGTNWLAVNSGLTDLDLSSVRIDPFNHDRIYAGSNSGVFTSNNGGISWIAVTSGLTDLNV